MKIVIISGDGDLALKTVNAFCGYVFDFDITIIQEKAFTLSNILRIIWKRILKRGIFNTIGMILYFAQNMLHKQENISELQHHVRMKVKNISSDTAALEFIHSISPDFILTVGCSLISSEFIQKVQVPIVNIHPGINPLYRGAGNIWACYDNNFAVTGVTLHFIDPGIDTGSIISNKFIDFKDKEIDFQSMNSVCMLAGAKLAAEYFMFGKKNVEPEFKNLKSKFRGYPTIFEYMQAKKNFLNLQSQK